MFGVEKGDTHLPPSFPGGFWKSSGQISISHPLFPQRPWGNTNTNLLRPWRSVSSPSLCRMDSTTSESLGSKTHPGKGGNPGDGNTDGGEGKVQGAGNVRTEATPKPSPNLRALGFSP